MRSCPEGSALPSLQGTAGTEAAPHTSVKLSAAGVSGGK